MSLIGNLLFYFFIMLGLICVSFATESKILTYDLKRDFPQYQAEVNAYILQHSQERYGSVVSVDKETRANLMAPYFYDNLQCSKNGKVGFLLLHGMISGPVSMLDIKDAILKSYPCSMVLIPIMSGHGSTLDNATQAQHEDWIASTVNSFKYLGQHTSRQIVIGHSVGGVLSLVLMQEGLLGEEDKLVLSAPALKLDPWWSNFNIANMLNALGVSYFPMQKLETHPFEIRSYVVNFLYQYHQLVKTLTKESALKKTVPILVLASLDDNIVDTHAVIDFFCQYSPASVYLTSKRSEKKRRGDYVKQFDKQCQARIKEMPFDYPQHKYINFRQNQWNNPVVMYCSFGLLESTGNQFSYDECERLVDQASYHEGKIDVRKKQLEHTFNPSFDVMVEEVILPFISARDF